MNNKATSATPELNLATEPIAAEDSFYCIPKYLDEVMTTDDELSNMFLETDGWIFNLVLRDRPIEQQLLAFVGLKQIIGKMDHRHQYGKRLRYLQLATSIGQKIQIDGFQDPKEQELLGILGILLFNERGKAIHDARNSGTKPDTEWLEENAGQIKDVSLACSKLDQSAREALVKKSRKGGKGRHKNTEAYRRQVTNRYEELRMRGELGEGVDHVVDRIYKELKDNKVPLQAIPSKKALGNWFRDIRMGRAAPFDDDLTKGGDSLTRRSFILTQAPFSSGKKSL
jgi:hypothetical protein